MDNVFVFKKYIPEDMLKRYTDIFDSYPPEAYTKTENSNPWYNDHTGPYIFELIDLWEHVSELIYPEYLINPQPQIMASRPGQPGMFVHSDSPGKGKVEMLTEADPFSTCSIIDYGLVAYLGDFEGGEIFYPLFDKKGNLKIAEDQSNIDTAFSYKPESGDVVIHSAYNPYEHGTKPVISGVRYAFSGFATEASLAPNTFYHYKSPGYIEHISPKTQQSLYKWSMPIETHSIVQA